MARTRTVRVLMAALAAALLAFQLFAHGAPAVEAHAAEPAAAAASLCDGPVEPEELSGLYWNRDRKQQEEDLLAVTATDSMAPATAAHAAADADGSPATPSDEQRAPGSASPAALQVFRC